MEFVPSLARCDSHRLNSFYYCACVISPILVAATPFFVVQRSNPALASVRLLGALGIALGAICSPWLAKSQSRVVGCLIVGLSSFIIGELPDWVLAPMGALSERSEGFFGTGWYMLFFAFERTLQPIAVFLASFCAAVLACKETRVQGFSDTQISRSNVWFAQGGVATGYLISFALCVVANVLGRMEYQAVYSLASELLTTCFAIALWIWVLKCGGGCYANLDESPDKLSTCKSCYMCLGLASGVASWQLLTRVVVPRVHMAPAYYVFAAASAAVLLLPIAFRTFLKALDEVRNHSDNNQSVTAHSDELTGSNDIRDSADTQRHWLQGHGLAPRELEIASAFVSGETSKDIAQRLGIQPSTVRATMQRVYKKTGASGKEDLLCMIGVSSAASSCRKGAPGVSGCVGAEKSGNDLEMSSSAEPRSLPLFFSIGLMVFFSLLPVGYQPTIWGQARQLEYGCVIALVVMVPSMYALLESPELFSLRDGKGGALTHSGMLILGLSGMLLLGASAAPLRLEKSIDSFEVVLSFAGTVLVIASLVFAQGSRTGPTERAAGINFIDRLRNSSYVDSLLIAGIVLAAFGLGIAWEELMRGPLWLNYSEQLRLFSLVLCGGLVGYELIAKERAQAFILAAIACVAWFLELRCALLLMGALFLAITVFCTPTNVRAIVVFAGLLSCSGGILCGDYFVNLVGSFLVGNSIYTAEFGGRYAYGIAVSQAFAVGSVALGAIASFLLLRVAYYRCSVCGKESGFPARDRIRYLLMGRGLNQTQVDVALCLLDGLPSAEIAQRMHYSRGTVNSARSFVYKSFGVHSRAELVSALSQLSGL